MACGNEKSWNWKNHFTLFFATRISTKNTAVYIIEFGEKDEERENVTYSKTKSKGDASVTISANAKSMQELHDVLKLAGITLPKNDDEPEEPEAHDHEHDHEDDKKVAVIGPGEIDDPAYTTNKQAIIDRLRDTLKAKLIR